LAVSYNYKKEAAILSWYNLTEDFGIFIVTANKKNKNE